MKQRCRIVKVNWNRYFTQITFSNTIFYNSPNAKLLVGVLEPREFFSFPGLAILIVFGTWNQSDFPILRHSYWLWSLAGCIVLSVWSPLKTFYRIIKRAVIVQFNHFFRLFIGYWQNKLVKIVIDCQVLLQVCIKILFSFLNRNFLVLL